MVLKKVLTEGKWRGPIKKQKDNNLKPISPPCGFQPSSFKQIAEHIKPDLDKMACEIHLNIFDMNEK